LCTSPRQVAALLIAIKLHPRAPSMAKYEYH
jgi:hypothetical protein